MYYGHKMVIVVSRSRLSDIHQLTFSKVLAPMEKLMCLFPESALALGDFQRGKAVIELPYSHTNLYVASWTLAFDIIFVFFMLHKLPP